MIRAMSWFGFSKKVYSLSRLRGWETMLSIQKVTADCVAVQFLINQ